MSHKHPLENDTNRPPPIRLFSARQLWLGLALFGCSLALYPMGAHALRTRVRARASMTVEAFRSGGQVVVRGKLIDSRQQAVSDANVVVEVKPLNPAEHRKAAAEKELVRSLLTSSHGRFEAKFAVDPVLRGHQQWRIDATFSGNTQVGRANVLREVNLAKPRAVLELEVKPALITTDLDEVEVAVFVSVLGIPMSGRALKLRLDGQPMAVLRTGEDGWAIQRVPTSALMPLGPHQVSVALPESDEHNAATQAAVVEIRAATLVTLASVGVEGAEACKPNQRCFRGEVTAVDPNGSVAPTPGATVTIHANKRRLVTLTADAEGRFFVRLAAQKLRRFFGTGDIGVVAEGLPTTAYSEPGWSEVVVVSAPPPTTLSEYFYFALLALIVIGLALRRLADRLREQGLARELADVSAGLPKFSVRRAGDGGIAATHVRGVVIHGETGRPTAATIHLTRRGTPPEQLEVPCPDGHFRIADLAAGDWTLRVSTAEHEDLTVQLQVPHDGTYDGCEFLPRSHRAVVRSEFGDVVAATTGQDMNWRKETPQLVEPRWMRVARRGHAEIRGAVGAVDVALYGRRTNPEEVGTARDAMALAQERAD